MRCRNCKGSGEIRDSIDGVPFVEGCEDCGGTGKVAAEWDPSDGSDAPGFDAGSYLEDV